MAKANCRIVSDAGSLCSATATAAATTAATTITRERCELAGRVPLPPGGSLPPRRLVAVWRTGGLVRRPFIAVDSPAETRKYNQLDKHRQTCKYVCIYTCA